MEEELKVDAESQGAGPPEKRAWGKRHALRKVIIVAIGLIVAAGLAYDAYCMCIYAHDFRIATATVSGERRCSRCGKTREIGYIYAGGPLPKPRPFALKSLKDAYERKRSHIEYMQKGRFDHACVGQQIKNRTEDDEWNCGRKE